MKGVSKADRGEGEKNSGMCENSGDKNSRMDYSTNNETNINIALSSLRERQKVYN